MADCSDVLRLLYRGCDRWGIRGEEIPGAGCPDFVNSADYFDLVSRL
jgi:hypothetical protein